MHARCDPLEGVLRPEAQHDLMRTEWRPTLSQNKVDGMIQHLSGLAQERLIISFAPKTLAYSILKRIGELFPGPSKVRS